ncbi:hypothetical protein CAOG_04549 [Capsaspora owczarzaki ATCC 30864]|uniref:Neurotransmitter-gated ion-channel ligand-binding domain-containing protein n=1 Tax=Capsaspora owczarzaki (strain ATCC 30864) TaxID=595528 RepID=A0A0D2UFB5_CAPO3|nr:hypothetical protein CAOG_04549 [Capsaspora owczarzaki ATCC 30864]KJE93806.1 hypothetical protein CAOG_004549 [Capsaspora owczarzaki ATCC 30864]|eukprot:XP_004347296.1 hypothetical protein CAOG_04549 [Capsaspora owczarzaki ATCC 30864]
MDDSLSLSESQNKRLRDFHLSGESEELAESLMKILRIPEGGNPQQKRVVVQVFVNRIFSVNDVEASVNLDFYLKVNWIDEKYIGVSDDDFQDDEQKFEEGWWEPGVEVSNAIELEKLIEKDEAFWVEHPAHGILAYTQRFIGTISTPMELQHFPFDSQKIPIVFESFHWKAEDMLMFRLEKHAVQFNPGPNKEWPTMSMAVTLPEWYKMGITLDDRINYYSFEDRNYSQIVFALHVKRNFKFFLYKVYAMVFLIQIMNWSIFVLDPDQLDARIGIAVTLFLAAVAFNFVLASTLPRISYNTRLDWYILIAYVYIVVALVESCIVFLIAKYHTESDAWDIAKNIDWAFLAFCPFSFFLYNLKYFISAWLLYRKDRFKRSLAPEQLANAPPRQTNRPQQSSQAMEMTRNPISKAAAQ